jgi:hypothetical protein
MKKPAIKGICFSSALLQITLLLWQMKDCVYAEMFFHATTCTKYEKQALLLNQSLQNTESLPFKLVIELDADARVPKSCHFTSFQQGFKKHKDIAQNKLNI